MVQDARPVAGKLDDLTEVLARDSAASLVVCSAPTAIMPAGYAPAWKVVCVNGSHAVARRFGIEVPDVLFVRGRLLGSKDTDRLVDTEALAVLNGGRARTVIVKGRAAGFTTIEAYLDKIDFSYEALRVLTNGGRDQLIHRSCGRWFSWLAGIGKVSTGVLAVMFTLLATGGPVIVTGISLSSNGHFYSSSNLPRAHIDADRRALRRLARRWPNLFTTDPVLAGQTGMRVWPTG